MCFSICSMVIYSQTTPQTIKPSISVSSSSLCIGVITTACGRLFIMDLQSLHYPCALGGHSSHWINCWAAGWCTQCTGYFGGDQNCNGDCPLRLFSCAHHHHHPSLGWCDFVVAHHLHWAISTTLGEELHHPIVLCPPVISTHMPWILLHNCTSQHCPAAVGPHYCCLSHGTTSQSQYVLGGQSCIGIALHHSACWPTWCKSHFSPGLSCMMIGSTYEQ